MKKNIIRTRNAEIFTDELGIVHEIYDQDSFVTIEDTTMEFRIFHEMSPGKKILLLVDLNGVKSVPRECRVMYGSKQSADICSALAMLVGTYHSRVIGNFFLGLNKPKIPVKLFINEEKAIEWLSEFMDQTR